MECDSAWYRQTGHQEYRRLGRRSNDLRRYDMIWRLEVCLELLANSRFFGVGIQNFHCYTSFNEWICLVDDILKAYISKRDLSQPS